MGREAKIKKVRNLCREIQSHYNVITEETAKRLQAKKSLSPVYTSSWIKEITSLLKEDEYRAHWNQAQSIIDYCFRTYPEDILKRENFFSLVLGLGSRVHG